MLVVVGDFVGILPRTRKLGSDGSGSGEKVKQAKTVTAGVAVVDHETGETAGIYSMVPGRQTVPRAEAWGLWLALNWIEPHIAYELVVDAGYLINATSSPSRWYIEGTNGDLWSRIYQASASRSEPLKLLKAKSHIKTAENTLSTT